LSRKDQVDTKEDNKDVQLLKEELWTRRTTAEVTMLKRNKITDNLDILKEQDGIVYMEGQIYIPNNKRLKERILQEKHNPVNVGYLEQQRMIELVKKNYWWPGLKDDIKKYMQSYIKCQQNKVQHQ